MAVFPVGAIILSADDTVPPGFYECNGQEIPRQENALLYAAIGDTYGDGNGTSTFNVPNLKGRVVVGLDPADVDFDDLGDSGGSKDNAMTVAQMPVHDHGITDPGHTHPVSIGTFASGGNERPARSNNAQEAQPNSALSNTTGITVDEAGDGDPFPVVQPYITLKFLILAVGVEV